MKKLLAFLLLAASVAQGQTIRINGGGVGKPVSQVITTGTNTTLTSRTVDIWAIVNPASTLATDTIKFPVTPIDQQIIKFSFGGTITTGTVVTSLVFQPNTSQALLGEANYSDVVVGDTIIWQWLASISKWYRQNN